ncbi:bifunctional DedA family/phosphatase PAP2 family protein [Marinobacteraceae bacterium S3BR75-40.1]
MLQSLSDMLVGHPYWIAAAITLVAFLESLALAGVVVPGVALLFAIALVAGNTGLSVWNAMAWAAVGAILGDGVSFALGRWLQDRVHQLWPFSRYPGMLRRGEHFFRRHGGKSVVAGRFVGPIRPVIPLVAGTFGMSSQRFLTFNVISALGWAPLYVLPGYMVGASMALDIHLPPHFYLILFSSLGILAALFILFFQVHLALGEEGRLYAWLQRSTRQSALGRAFWQHMQRPRPGQAEFPLASLTLAIGATALFALWSVFNVETNLLQPFNQACLDFFVALRSPVIDPVFIAITKAGDSKMLWWGFGLLITYLTATLHRAAALHVLFAGLAVLLLTYGLKTGFGISRPEVVFPPPNFNSYPSGHASGNTVFYGLLAAFFAQEWPARHRWRVYAVGAIPIVLIALSRLFLNVHWFSDVVGGILLGLAICGWARFSFNRFDDRPLPLGRTTYALGALWATGVVVYVAWQWSTAVTAYQLL